jgi:hypothetical protein
MKRKERRMPVTLNDLPKAFLVDMVEASYKAFNLPLPEKEMATAVVSDRLHRAHREAKACQKKAASIKKMRAGRARNKLIDQATAHAKRMERLHGSALQLAEEYGLKETFFKKGEDHEGE